MSLSIESIMKGVATLLLMQSLAVTPSHALTGRPSAAQGTRDAVQKRADLRLKVIDGATKKPISNTAVEIYSDNGRRCIKAPCPTNGIKWAGRTDARGVVTIPGKVRQRSMTISAAGYGGKDLTRESKKAAAGLWVIALDVDSGPGRREE